MGPPLPRRMKSTYSNPSKIPPKTLSKLPIQQGSNHSHRNSLEKRGNIGKERLPVVTVMVSTSRFQPIRNSQSLEFLQFLEVTHDLHVGISKYIVQGITYKKDLVHNIPHFNKNKIISYQF